MPKQLTNDGTSAIRHETPVLDDLEIEPDETGQLATLTVDDLLGRVRSGEVTATDALAAEREGRARVTAIAALEELVDAETQRAVWGSVDYQREPDSEG